MSQTWDSHVHLFTKEMSDDPSGWAERTGESGWKACVAPPDRPSIQGWATADQLLHAMDNAEIERVILQGWYWESMESCRLQNRFYAQLIQQHSDRVSAFATIQPKDGKIAEELNWAKDHGFIGIGEIHPQAQGFSLTDQCWAALIEQIQDWNFVVNFHVTDPDTGDHPGKILTPLSEYLDLAQAFPNQDFILSHLGALIPLREEFRLRAKQITNLYYDCAAIPLLYPSAKINEVAAVVGADRLLFGSDYPLRVFPKTQKQPEFLQSLEFVRESGLTDEQLELVFTKNAKRLLRG